MKVYNKKTGRSVDCIDKAQAKTMCASGDYSKKAPKEKKEKSDDKTSSKKGPAVKKGPADKK